MKNDKDNQKINGLIKMFMKPRVLFIKLKYFSKGELFLFAVASNYELTAYYKIKNNLAHGFAWAKDINGIKIKRRYSKGHKIYQEGFWKNKEIFCSFEKTR